MRTRFIGIGVAVVGLASVVVVGAQHRAAPAAATPVASTAMALPCANHQAPTHTSASMVDHAAMAQRHGGAAHASSAPDHASAMTSALGLSSEQTAQVQAISTEMCAAIAKFHEQMMAVLTPEQRAKLHAMHDAHGSDGVSGLHAFFRWLHGGGR